MATSKKRTNKKLDTLEKIERSGLQDRDGDTLDLANAIRKLKGKPPLKPARARAE